MGVVAGGVGGGLGLELGEVEVGAGLVAGVHGLAELVFAVEAVEDDRVDGDGDELDDDFDDAADQRPVLQAADERVVHVILEEFFAFVVLAGPAPHVLAAAGGFAAVEDTRGDEPHDGGEGEVADGEDGVVHGGFGGAAVARAPVGGDHDDGEDQGDDGDGEDGVLRPGLGGGGPGGEVVAGWEGFGGVEDGEGGAEHGEDDEGAGEVGAAEDHLRHADTGFDFLDRC